MERPNLSEASGLSSPSYLPSSQQRLTKLAKRDARRRNVPRPTKSTGTAHGLMTDTDLDDNILTGKKHRRACNSRSALAYRDVHGGTPSRYFKIGTQHETPHWMGNSVNDSIKM